MDYSPEYIKMILALPKSMREEPAEGDYFYNLLTGDKGKLGEVYFDTSKMIKLYEQDQLQEMAFSSTSGTDHKMIRELNIFYDYWDTNGIPTIFFTWEQLWLAFVMHENHGMVWINDKWEVK